MERGADKRDSAETEQRLYTRRGREGRGRETERESEERRIETKRIKRRVESILRTWIDAVLSNHVLRFPRRPPFFLPVPPRLFHTPLARSFLRHHPLLVHPLAPHGLRPSPSERLREASLCYDDFCICSRPL